MRIRLGSFCIVVAAALFACDSGTTTTDVPDAAQDAATDSPPGDAPDAPDTVACTGALYDTCDLNNAATCAQGTYCQAYNQAGITVCVQDCDANNPCPAQDGAAVSCNGMGRCRPDAANDCELP